jgi:methyl-accepting chemotaxis protein
MDWADVLRAAAAFFLVLTGLSLTFVLVRLAGTLDRVNALLGSIDREALPMIGKVSATVDQVSQNLEQVDRILVTTADGVESADRTVRRVGRVVEVPVGKVAEASAWVGGATSSFRARRAQRRGRRGP